MNKKGIIIGLLSLVFLTGCTNPFDALFPDKSEPNVDETSSGQVESSSTNEVDPSKPVPTGIKVKQNKSEYIFSSAFNPDQDFEVEVSFSDGEKRQVSYTTNKNNGWYFVAISDETGKPLEKLPNTFDTLTTYRVRVGATFNAKTVRYNKIYNLEVVGGSHSDVAPDSLTITNKRSNYIVDDIFSTEDIIVSAIWNNLGGEEFIEPGNGTNGYTVTGTNFDINEPLTKTGSFEYKVSYRGLEKTQSFNVLRYDTSEITYDYNDATRDSVYAIDIMPTKGKTKALIVPIWFKDSHNFVKTQSEKDKIRNDIKIAYTGTPEETGWHSVRSYYLEDSYGQLEINGVVTDWFEVDYYGATVNQQNTVDIVKKASDWYRSQVSAAEWKTFDSDHNGFIDAVITIYAYPYYNHPSITTAEQGSGNENLWAYCFWVQDRHNQIVDNPGPNTFFWASYQFMYSGLGDSPMKIDGHTFIHEMGHVLGLKDYYDYNNLSTPAAGFSMQDSNVGGHDPFSKLAYGWLKPYVPNKSVSITLKPFTESGEIILLTPEFHNSPFDEYLILEYYTPTGLNELDTTYRYKGSYPFGTQESGIRLWHVDARLHAYFVDKDNELFIDEQNLYTRMPKDAVGVTLAMGNTTIANTPMDGHASVLPENYDYRLLSLLSQYESESNTRYNFNFQFSHRHLWQVGDTFSMKEFEYSFPNIGKLNSHQDLGFEFEVISQSSKSISINIIKK